MASALQRLLPGTAWSSIGSAASQGATLVGNVVVANALGPAGFGVYSFLQGTINNWALVAHASTGLMATRYISAYSRDEPVRASQLLGLSSAATLLGGCTSALLLVFFSDSISAWTVSYGPMDAAILVAAAGLPFATFSLFQVGVLVGMQRFREIAMISLTLCGAFVGLPLWGAWAAGPAAAIAGLASAFFLRFCLNAWVIQRASREAGIAPMLSGFAEFRRLFAAFALPASVTGLTTAGSLWYATFLLLGQPSGSSLVGLLGAAMTFRMLVLFIPAQLASVSVGFLTRHFAAGREADYSQVMGASLVLTAVSAVVVAGVLLAVAEPLLRLFGPEFPAALPIARIMLAAAIVEAVAMSLYQSLPSRAQMWRSLGLVAIPRDLAFVVGATWAIPRYLGEGFAGVMMMSQLIGLAGVIAARAIPVRAVQERSDD